MAAISMHDMADMADNELGNQKSKYDHFELEHTVDIYEYLQQL